MFTIEAGPVSGLKLGMELVNPGRLAIWPAGGARDTEFLSMEGRGF